MGVDFAQQGLECRVEFAVSMVGRMRYTGDLPKLPHPLLQSCQRKGMHPIFLCHLAAGYTFKPSRDRSEIAVKTGTMLRI
jgi:hypothetical protein